MVDGNGIALSIATKEAQQFDIAIQNREKMYQGVIR